MILAIFDPLPPCKGMQDFSNPSPYSFVRFHFVFQHNKMLLEKDQLGYTKTAHPNTFFAIQVQIPDQPLDRAISSIKYRLGKYYLRMGLTPSPK